jgi:short-subunit dehydrogenase
MHIVITGASSGIGAALARTLATLPGARLTLLARRRALLSALAREIAVPVRIVERDLAAADADTAWLEDAEREHGPVDVLVNNAGAQVIGPTASADLADGEASLVLNLHTPLRLWRAVLPGMLARRAGCIVDVASMAALAPTPGMTFYNASKAGLAAASEALRGELRGTGVHVVTVYPGIITTDLADRALARYGHSRALALQPRSTPERLAADVLRAIVRRRARVVHPRFNVLARWFPTVVRWVMDRFTPALRPAAAATATTHATTPTATLVATRGLR